MGLFLFVLCVCCASANGGFGGFGNNGGTDGGNGNDGGCPFAGLKSTECHNVNGVRKRQKKICNNNKQWEVVESDDGGADCDGFGGFGNNGGTDGGFGGFGSFGNNGGTDGGYGGKRAAKPSLFLSKLVRDEDSQQQK